MKKIIITAIGFLFTAILLFTGCNLGDRPVIEPEAYVYGQVTSTGANYSIHFDNTEIVTSDPVAPGHMVYYFEFINGLPDAPYLQKGYTPLTHVHFLKSWDFSERTNMVASEGNIYLTGDYRVIFYWCETYNLNEPEIKAPPFSTYDEGNLIYLGEISGGVYLEMRTPYPDSGSLTYGGINGDGDDFFTWTTSTFGSQIGTIDTENKEEFDSRFVYIRNSFWNGARIRLDGGDWNEVSLPTDNTFVWPSTIAAGDHTVELQFSDEAGHWGSIESKDFTK